MPRTRDTAYLETGTVTVTVGAGHSSYVSTGAQSPERQKKRSIARAFRNGRSWDRTSLQTAGSGPPRYAPGYAPLGRIWRVRLGEGARERVPPVGLPVVDERVNVVVGGYPLRVPE
jgi:hypothetical protein